MLNSGNFVLGVSCEKNHDFTPKNPITGSGLHR